MKGLSLAEMDVTSSKKANSRWKKSLASPESAPTIILTMRSNVGFMGSAWSLQKG